MSERGPSRVSRLPLVLLGIMTILTFAGPFVLGWVLSGGRETGWPPDRPVEWAALLGAAGLVALLMIVLIVLGLANAREMKAVAGTDRPRAEP